MCPIFPLPRQDTDVAHCFLGERILSVILGTIEHEALGKVSCTYAGQLPTWGIKQPYLSIIKWTKTDV